MQPQSKLLIILGFGLLLWGFNMDTTVASSNGRVANIHLISKQNNATLIGGFLFLAGVILLGFGKKGEALKQKSDDQESQSIVKIVEPDKEDIRLILSRVGQDGLPESERLRIGIFLGVSTTLALYIVHLLPDFDIASVTVCIVAIVLSVVISHMCVPIKRATRWLLSLNIVVICIALVLNLLAAYISSQRLPIENPEVYKTILEHETEFMMVMVGYPFLIGFLLIGASLYFLRRIKSIQSLDMPEASRSLET